MSDLEYQPETVTCCGRMNTFQAGAKEELRERTKTLPDKSHNVLVYTRYWLLTSKSCFLMRHKSNAIPRMKITWAKTWMTKVGAAEVTLARSADATSGDIILTGTVEVAACYSRPHVRCGV